LSNKRRNTDTCFVIQKKTKMYYEILIIDNTLALYNQFNEIIFQIFQRLHTHTQYSGKGIVLAII